MPSAHDFTSHATPTRSEAGVAGLVIMVLSLLVVLVVSMWSFGVFTGHSKPTDHQEATQSIFSQSMSEQELRLCVEGKPPRAGAAVPTQAQQAHCTLTLGQQAANSASNPFP